LTDTSKSNKIGSYLDFDLSGIQNEYDTTGFSWIDDGVSLYVERGYAGFAGNYKNRLRSFSGVVALGSDHSYGEYPFMGYNNESTSVYLGEKGLAYYADFDTSKFSDNSFITKKWYKDRAVVKFPILSKYKNDSISLYTSDVDTIIPPYSLWLLGNAGKESTNSLNSILIGNYAGAYAGYNQYSVIIGDHAGSNTTYGADIAIGKAAGAESKKVSGSVFIGEASGGYCTSASNSIFLGTGAGFQSYGTDYSIFIGYTAGAGQLKDQKSDTLYENNIIIGNCSTLPSHSRNMLNIGNLIYGTSINSDLTNGPMYEPSGGKIGINNYFPSYTLDVNGTTQATKFKLSALNTAPTSATDSGETGEVRVCNGYIYICVATNTWQRCALSTF
jgi:hypothetical protein